jgi:hypothetical protein
MYSSVNDPTTCFLVDVPLYSTENLARGNTGSQYDTNQYNSRCTTSFHLKGFVLFGCFLPSGYG